MSSSKKIAKSPRAVFLVVATVLFIVGFVTFGNLSNLQEVTVASGNGFVNFNDGTSVEVEIADSNAEKVKGLSGHVQLGPEEGMLFLYEKETTPGFWMKDMGFVIDIIWINDDLVISLNEYLPPEDPVKTLYYPEAPVDRVLEVPSGFIEEHGVMVGDRLDITLPES